MDEKTYVNLENAREQDQREIMERIRAAGVCAFCPEGLKISHLGRLVKAGDYWILHENRWPYKFTLLHIMAIHTSHAERLCEISPQAWEELLGLLQWVEREYRVDSGAIGMRFGDPEFNGATVKHFHVHFIVADPLADQLGYERVRFPMGPKPKSRQKENNPVSYVF